LGCGEPDPLIAALVVEIPSVILVPGRRCSVWTAFDRRAVGLADVQRSVIGPGAAVGRGQEMRDVVLPFGEHEVRAVSAHHAHVLDPGIAENRVRRITGPVNSVGRRRMPQRHGRGAITGVARVPEVERPIVAFEDETALTDLAVPGFPAGSGESLVAG